MNGDNTKIRLVQVERRSLLDMFLLLKLAGGNFRSSNVAFSIYQATAYFHSVVYMMTIRDSEKGF